MIHKIIKEEIRVPTAHTGLSGRRVQSYFRQGSGDSSDAV